MGEPAQGGMPREEYAEDGWLTGLAPFAVSELTAPRLLHSAEVYPCIPFLIPACETRWHRWCVMVDRRPPSVLAGEKETLLAFLAYLRDCLVAKLDGISPADARRAGVPSGTSLLGLIKHVTAVEAFWLQHAFAGLSPDDVIPGDELTADDTPVAVIDTYRTIAATSTEIIRRCDDLDIRAAVAPFGPPAKSMRWLLVHMIEETARHAGHADILREQIDGVVGR